MNPLHSLGSLIFSSISFVVMSMRTVSLQQAAQLNDTKSRDLAGCERRVCVNIDHNKRRGVDESRFQHRETRHETGI